MSQAANRISSGDLDEYFRDAAREPLLSAEQERELARTIEVGREAAEKLTAGRIRAPLNVERAKRQIRAAEAARDRFVRANLRLVISIARTYYRGNVPLSDLIQEGNIGLMRAVELFDWRRGLKFSTYATWWIRQAIGRAIQQQSPMIRLPARVHERLRVLNRARKALRQQGQREPRADELARASGLRLDDVLQLLRCERLQPLSLDAPVMTDAPPLVDLLDASLRPEEDPQVVVVDGAPVQALSRAMVDVLEERERAVLSLRFGLGGGRRLSLEQAGKELGLSREWIRQTEKAALGKLRAMLAAFEPADG
ncbi:MAG TPA: sigma-70 family RNA polymerase sigma factor [Actinomycetota bacterium]|jgi:RNA polymerase primary sigma factor|nr:sigma-70 family RNA polymerase sigma factor [Actinomycetota bacterium]